MPEGEPTPEYTIVINPYEKLILDFIDNVKDDWNGYGSKLFLVRGLDAIARAEEAKRVTDAYMQSRTDTFGELNE